jgi:hypothetical protein
VYTLGRINAFGALWDLGISEKQLAIWRIHLIMGPLHGQYRSADAMFFRDAPALLLERIRDSLRGIFGVARADQEDGLREYEQSLLIHVSELSYHEELRLRRTTDEH